jgi:hypothetical protein
MTCSGNLARYALLGSLAFSAAAVSISADAATIIVQASGQVANTTYGSFVANGRSYQTGTLILDPLDPLPFEVNDGDTIQFSISLDGLFGVPGAGEQFFGVNFYGAEDQEAAGASNEGSILFQNASGLPANPVDAGCGNCLSLIYGANNAAAFSFDGLSGSTLVSLSTPYFVDQISISYQVSDAIPEPASWMMLIAGFAIVGGVIRRRPLSRAALA